VAVGRAMTLLVEANDASTQAAHKIAKANSCQVIRFAHLSLDRLNIVFLPGRD
jgi:hypothetical protein